MKRFQHILVVIAFMGASLPCLHAEVHEGHVHADADEKSMCEIPAQSSTCHSCDETAFDTGLQSTPVWSVQLPVMASSSVFLFDLSERRLFIRQPAITTHGALLSLRTVRLLT
jgi:hypothetical protein